MEKKFLTKMEQCVNYGLNKILDDSRRINNERKEGLNL